ncbi:MAG: hypothetical protein PHC61_15010 [Chitinivibrionales bacterium]|nr:hypothetical protein [Chitinivibrionales bacterium]
MPKSPANAAVAFFFAGCLCFFSGCGVSEKKLDEADKRIMALTAKGAPDSLLTQARVCLYQASTAAKTGSGSAARKYADSLMIYLAKAESEYASAMQRYKPLVDSLVGSFNTRKKNLSGLVLKYADSVIANIDSLTGKNWLYQAREICQALDSTFPSLIAEENKGNAIRPKLIGTWVKSLNPNSQYKALEISNYKINKDGTYSADESMKGQTEENAKEDWQFLSSGTWDVKGDTILFFPTREKCVRQNFMNYKMKDGKMQWVPYVAPTYDSTITNHKKDKFMTFDFIKESFRKK